MSSSFGNGSNSQDVDLNITPIIDCFTVLITFLLASASFLSIGFLEANTPGNNSDPSSGEPDTEALIHLKPNQVADFRVKGKIALHLSFDLSKPDELKRLNGEVQKLASSQAKLSQILLGADDEVDYKSIAAVMGELNDSKLPIVVGEF